MKRTISLSMAVLLISAAVCSPAARAENSANRDMITAEDVQIPLVEAPDTVVEAAVQEGRDGTATATASSGDLLSAVDAVNNEGAVRITVTAAGTEDAAAVTAVQPREALRAVVGQTNAELCIESAVGRVTLLNAVLASVVDDAGGDDVSITLRALTSAQIQALLDGRVDADAAQIAAGSGIEVSITSGGTAITDLGGGLITVSLPVGDAFQEGMRYNVYQPDANGGVRTFVGRCVMAGGRLWVEFECGGPGIFIVLPDPIGSDAAAESPHMVPSPLADRAAAGAPAPLASVQQWCGRAVKQLLHLLGV